VKVELVNWLFTVKALFGCVLVVTIARAGRH